ncbi:pyridoxal phosphate-dependent aminotransferase [Brevibacterium linens]|uniref:pyridoxal phosphate-dependent aminotransferase n=1 Tax=Brevibacterium linens TaxID=1703 RepID=UPI0035196E8D
MSDLKSPSTATFGAFSTDVQSPAIGRIAAASRRPAGLGSPIPGAVSLAMGEPDEQTAPHIIARAKTALDDGLTHYAPASGEPDLKQKLADYESTLAGRHVSAESIVLAHGATGALSSLVIALVSPGDKVVVPAPTYSLYVDLLAMVGAVAVPVPLRSDNMLDIEAIRAQVQDARMLIICNPSNPTGAVYDAEQLSDVAALLTEFPELVLVSDEAYSEIVFDDVDFVSALALSSTDREHDVQAQIIKVGTFSKTFAMTGWRLGYCAAPRALAHHIDLIQRTLNGALATFVQDAALAALATAQSELNSMRATYQRRRDQVIEELQASDRVTVNTPKGAFYAFPHIDTSLSSLELVDAFAAGGLLVRAGSEYGLSGEGHVRLSFAADDEAITEGLRRFTTVVSQLPR